MILKWQYQKNLTQDETIDEFINLSNISWIIRKIRHHNSDYSYYQIDCSLFSKPLYLTVSSCLLIYLYQSRKKSYDLVRFKVNIYKFSYILICNKAEAFFFIYGPYKILQDASLKLLSHLKIVGFHLNTCTLNAFLYHFI